MALTNPGNVIVRPPAAAPAAETNDIRAIRPPVEIPGGWAWLLWVVLAALALAALVTLLMRRLRRPPAVPQEEIVPPHIRARRRLERALGLITDQRAFCIEISEALRVYLEERFQLRAPDRTTEEFLQDLRRTTALDDTQKTALTGFLEHCDLVKFARFEPSEDVLRGLHESALRLVDETSLLAVPAAP